MEASVQSDPHVHCCGTRPAALQDDWCQPARRLLKCIMLSANDDDDNDDDGKEEMF